MPTRYTTTILALSALVGALSGGLITIIIINIDPYLRIYAVGIAFAIGFLMTAGISAVFVKVLKV